MRRGFVFEKGDVVGLQFRNHCYSNVLVVQELDCLVKCKVGVVALCCCWL